MCKHGDHEACEKCEGQDLFLIETRGGPGGVRAVKWVGMHMAMATWNSGSCRHNVLANGLQTAVPRGDVCLELLSLSSRLTACLSYVFHLSRFNRSIPQENVLPKGPLVEISLDTDETPVGVTKLRSTDRIRRQRGPN